MTAPSSKSGFLDFLESTFGIRPKQLLHYDCAFTHRSIRGLYDWMPLTATNERLELLGDAVIELMSTHYLYNKFPTWAEGDLTNARAALVSRKNMNRWGWELKLVSYAIYNTHSNPSLRNMSGNVLEALYGALYLDQGFEVAYESYVKSLVERFAPVDSPNELQQHPAKTKLASWASQSNRKLNYAYTVFDAHGKQHVSCDLAIDDVIYARTIGRSKREASREAAHMALERLISEGENIH